MLFVRIIPLTDFKQLTICRTLITFSSLVTTGASSIKAHLTRSLPLAIQNGLHPNRKERLRREERMQNGQIKFSKSSSSPRKTRKISAAKREI